MASLYSWASANLSLVASMLTASTLILAAGLKFGSRTIKVGKGVYAVIVLGVSLNDRLGRIEGQLFPNGGSSLWDAVGRIERSQRLQDRSHEALMDLHDSPYWRSDRFGACEWVNKAYRDLAGRSIDDLRGNNWINCVHPDDRRAVFAAWREAIEQKRDFEMAYRIQGRDVVTPVYAQAKVIHDASGEVIGFIGSLCDSHE